VVCISKKHFFKVKNGFLRGFLSARELPCASSDRFCLLSLIQIYLYQQIYAHKPSPAQKFKSEKIPRRIPKRIPKSIPKRIPKESL
jgi:hypothetical protein